METDKKGTGLFADYERLFAPFKDQPITYLEIGVANGGSLAWARKFFSKADILGIDIRRYPGSQPDGTSFFEFDQNDTKGLSQFAETHGPFDIIIDDASHYAKETENTFYSLYPFLLETGLYIIEDWGAGYFEQWPKCQGMEKLVIDLVWKHKGTIIKNRNHGTFAIIGKSVLGLDIPKKTD